jgi:hypothetical protein
LEAALRLPDEERLALISRLLETIPAERFGRSIDDDSLAEELERRFSDLAGSVPWSELKAES